MHNIVFLDAGSMGDADLSVLADGEIALQCFEYTPTEDIVSRLAQASIAIVNKVQLSAAILQQLPNLKLICIAATGVNNVDLDAAARLGINVCNVRGYA
ncbi:MAG: glycerate dehydrogenase, partial [Rheinheimera aquimaris]